MSEALHPETKEIVDRDGWGIMHAYNDTETPNPLLKYSYTVNFTERCGLPDLIIFGLNKDIVRQFIGRVAAMGKDGIGWAGEPVQVDGILVGHKLELRPIHASWLPSSLSQADAWLREQGKPALKEAVQLFWPGEDGLFPWDAEHADPFPEVLRMDLPISKSKWTLV